MPFQPSFHWMNLEAKGPYACLKNNDVRYSPTLAKETAC